MRSTLLCVLFTFFVQRGGSLTVKDDDFRPTPIPLDDWHHDYRRSPAGTLQETIKTNSSAAVAAIPAHYWEDALRHSVYLTLVRDKIDQLISNQKPEQQVSKEVDDRDLWHKIKTAPFDRLNDQEPAAFGDITIMAKGKLLEEKEGFRFTEDKASKDKCDDDKCMEGVKAFWSVKRVRQRDVETSPGKYHYELTFSVTSKASAQKQRKRYETPIRTFTVRENSSAENFENRLYEPKQSRLQRPQRAIWFHKNIVPTQNYQGRNYNQGLDRIFSSLFTDEDSFNDPRRYKQNTYIPQVFPQYSKIGHVGAPSDQHHQKKLMPYPYKPQTFKYSRPPLQAPPVPHSQHHYLDFDPMINMHYTPSYMDQRHVSSDSVKTTRPAVLPTPPISLPQLRNFTIEETNINQLNITDYPTKNPEIVTPLTLKMHNKPKPTPMKISYFPDHVRPPVFSAPPGVFVTMDKKPFKPMPPLKLIHSSKPMRNKPTDFRPSPQVLDIQFSDPDPLQDSAFRPITVKYADNNITEPYIAGHGKKKNSRKPAKKHEKVKSHRVTTTTFTPDIITAGSESIDDKDNMQWANLLGAFTRTTPMASQREKVNTTESFVSVTSVTVPITVINSSTTTTASTTQAAEATTTISTTPRPKKRTRPPPKFTKSEKIKKHKRITSTSTTTKAPEVILQTKQPQQDLTPQATSSVTGGLKHKWEPKNKTTSTTPLTTSTETFTTSRPPTTTTVVSTPTKDIEESHIATTQQKIKNRFRQSTLMQKGTSVKHDKWSMPNFEKTTTKLTISPSGKLSTRRKGSNFHGYLPSSTPKYLNQKETKEDHEDHVSSPYMTNISSTTENIPENKTESSTQPSYEDSLDQSDRDKEVEPDLLPGQEEFSEDSVENTEKNEDFDNHEESKEQESRDHSEYIFQNLSTIPSETINEIIEVVNSSPTEATVISSPQPVLKNKTKCKKKKHHNLTTTVETPKQSNEFENEIVTNFSTTSTTESAATPDIFEELFGGFTMDETSEKPKELQLTTKSEPDEEESENHERYVQIDDDFEDFLDSLEKKENHSDVKIKDEEEYEDDKDFSTDEEESPFNYEDENEAARNSKDDYDEYHDRQYSLLELMAME